METKSPQHNVTSHLRDYSSFNYTNQEDKSRNTIQDKSEAVFHSEMENYNGQNEFN